jgi:UDP-GlcNAc:undecaprenyl-phosphate/decaprenyl-phosphate GlcNAc-1-phosphate transferase
VSLTLVFTSFCLTTLFLFFFQKLFIENNIVDKINSRSSHVSTATRSGGVALFSTIFLISIILYLAGIDIFNYSFLVPLSVLFAIGLYDDVYNIDFKLKFIFQIIAAKIIIDSGLIIDNLHGVFGIDQISRISSQILTLFVIIAIINAVNFIDGIDSLAILVISFFILGFEFFASESTGFYNLSIIIMCSFIPMLYLNLRKNNKVFLGDSGSLFLGGLVSIYVLYILSNNYLIIEKFDLNKIFFVFSILIYPIIDLTRVVLVRLFNGRSPFSADRNHIHHKINSVVKSHYKVAGIIIILSILNLITIQLIFN